MNSYPSSARIVLGLIAGLSLVACGNTWQFDAAAAPAAPLLIMGDTNRDGTVDAADAEGRSEWTAGRGAIFLNNNDSDDNTRDPDNLDEVVNGPSDLEDMALVRVMASPAADLTLNIDRPDMVRLFLRHGAGDYRVVVPGQAGNLPATLGGADGWELRIEGRQYATPAWDGMARLTVTAADGRTDTAALRVAPFLLLSNMNRARTVYVRDYPTRNEAFIAGLQRVMPMAGTDLYIVGAQPVTGYSANNIWMQDTMEVGWTAMPGKGMNVVLKANRNKPLDAFSREYLLGPDYGWLQVGQFRREFGAGDGGNSWLDWYGNLEVTPPLPGWPWGRVLYGADGTAPDAPGLNPEIVAMLNAQGVQGPALRLDVGWLLIKHVDEMVSFLPSIDPACRYKVMVPDTGVALSLMRQWRDHGHGAAVMFDIYPEKTTIDALLANTALVAYNERLQRERIEPAISMLKSELGLQEVELVRVPYLQTESRAAIIPNLINSLVVNGHLVAPDPRGPVIDGKDQLQQAFRTLVASSGLEVHFVDDRRYHTWSGNVHCGTNARREPYDTPWWAAGRP
jgi:protein-arginine deiminase